MPITNITLLAKKFMEKVVTLKSKPFFIIEKSDFKLIVSIHMHVSYVGVNLSSAAQRVRAFNLRKFEYLGICQLCLNSCPCV